MRKLSPLVAALAIAVPAAAWAGAPQPRKPVDPDRFVGRWHEVARTPNPRQANCAAATMDWTRSGEGFVVAQTCRQGSASGPAKTTRARATPVRGANGNKVTMSFMGGVIRQEYWILDRAEDYSWAVAGTPGGNYVWVLSRRPDLAPAQLNAVLGRVRALGYDTARLDVPGRGAEARAER